MIHTKYDDTLIPFKIHVELLPKKCPVCGQGEWFRDTDGKLKMNEHDLDKHGLSDPPR